MAALALYNARRHDEAVRCAERALELQPEYALGLWILGLACCGTGDFTRAIDTLTTLVALTARAVMFTGTLGLACGLAGRHEEARELLRELQQRRAHQHVGAAAELFIQVGLRDRDGICSSFDACLAEGVTGFSLEALTNPFLDELATDPRIAGYMRRLRMVPSRTQD